MEACDNIKDARTHLRQAARAFEDRVLGREVTSHLRQAAKSVLKAGLAAIDERERGTAPGDTPK